MEARLALAHLAQVLPTDDPAVTELFQGVVPGCWWDLWQTRQSEEVANSASEKSVLKPTAAPRRWTVVVALVLGVVLGAGAAGLGVAVSRGLGAAELLRRVEFGGASSVSSAPANSPALGTPIALASEVATEVKAPLEAAKPEALDWRQTRLARIRSEFPALERLHKTLAQGSMREAGGILKGSSSLAGMGSASYQALLEWAMLELPQDAEVRRAVIRYYLMSNPLKDTLPLLEQLAGPGEPHRGEIREMASILLTLNERVLSPEERSRLEQVGR